MIKKKSISGSWLAFWLSMILIVMFLVVMFLIMIKG